MGRSDRPLLPTTLAACVLACTQLAASCGGGTPRPRLVVLFATCSLNRDCIAPYDPSVRYTPHLAAFAEEAVVFRRHSTEGGQSGTDFAALFSGTQAPVHGVYHHPRVIPPDVQLISETFAQAGYETHYWNRHPLAPPKFGYGQGVAQEHQHLSGNMEAFLCEDDPDFRAVLDELVAEPEKRVFVMANFSVTHFPYQFYTSRETVEAFLRDFPEWSRGVTGAELDTWTPIYDQHRHELQWDFPGTIAALGLSPAQVQRLAAVVEVLYRSNLVRLDAIFGRMLATLAARGLDDESVVAFTCDHGEILYRENALFQWTHGLELVPEVLDVPLMIRAPGVAPRDYGGTTRSIDVYPTLAGLCAVPIVGARPPDGVDLSAALRGTDAEPELFAFSHTTTLSAAQLESYEGLDLVLRYFPRAADPELCWVRVRAGDLVAKHVNLDGKHFGFQVFDLARDPHETNNLHDPGSSVHQDLERRLLEYKRALVAGFAPHFSKGQGRAPSDTEELEALQALGYVK